MPVLPSTGAQRYVGFKSGAFAKSNDKGEVEDKIFIHSLEGYEAISRPYRFELSLLSADVSIDSAQMLRSPARIRLKRERGPKFLFADEIHGVLTKFEYQGTYGPEGAKGSGSVYRAEFVTRIARLSLANRPRIFLGKSVAQIVDEVLAELKLVKRKEGDEGEEGEWDYAFQFDAASYPAREYVVQYQESDLNFLSRLLEHEGIFYYFRQGETRERMIFADKAEEFPMLSDDGVPYNPVKAGDAPDASSYSWLGDEAVRNIAFKHNVLPKEVVLQEYDYRQPDVALRASAPVHSEGTGTVYFYGENYRTPAEGQALAKVRAEEIRCRERVYTGTSDCKSFRAGYAFAMSGHRRAELNRSYVLTEIRHFAQQTVTVLGAASDSKYRNEFVAIPADAPYRPARTSPKPKITGSVSARIDGPADAIYAQVDDQGRYRVKLAFDPSEQGNGQASLPVRLLQPYAGPNHGLHCSLRVGTEVVVDHENGNPDRPVILGTVPNPKTQSPLRDTNSSQCVWRSAGNNAIVFEDLKDEELIFVHAQRDLHVRARREIREWTAEDRHEIVKRNRFVHVENDQHQKIDRDAFHEVVGRMHLTVGNLWAVDVGGDASIKVSKDVVEEIGKNRHQAIAEGSYVRAKTAVIEVSEGMTLKCGSSSVVIDAAGVTITGDAVILDGKKTKISSGPGSPPASGVSKGVATAQIPQDALEPKEIDELTGLLVASGNSDATAVPPAGGEKSSWISLELKDKKGQPMAGERFVLKLPDGGLLPGYLDKGGKRRVGGIPAGSCEVMFPRIDDD